MKETFCFLICIVVVSCTQRRTDYAGYEIESDHLNRPSIVLYSVQDTVAVDMGGALPTKYAGRKLCFIGPDTLEEKFVGNGGEVISSFVHQIDSLEAGILVVAQTPSDWICECSHDCRNQQFGSTICNFDFEKLCKEGIDQIDSVQFWLIEIDSDSVFGPISEKEKVDLLVRKLGQPQHR